MLAVEKQIRAKVHADIGSDHGNLLLALLKSGQISLGIAIENNETPFQNSIAALRVFFPPRPSDGTASGIAEVRLGDGLAALEPGEADSLSICGLGGQAIARILRAFPDRVPARVVLQPNNRAEAVREWAWETGFQLVDELTVGHEREFVVLSFNRPGGIAERGTQADTISDPAYRDLDFASAILFGPLIIKRNEPGLLQRLNEEISYWSQFSQLKTPAAQRLKVVQDLKTFLDNKHAPDKNKASNTAD